MAENVDNSIIPCAGFSMPSVFNSSSSAKTPKITQLKGHENEKKNMNPKYRLVWVIYFDT
jgi:hypothetical protein